MENISSSDLNDNDIVSVHAKVLWDTAERIWLGFQSSIIVIDLYNLEPERKAAFYFLGQLLFAVLQKQS